MRYAILGLCTFAFVASATTSARLSQSAGVTDVLALRLPTKIVPFRADVSNSYPTHASSGTFHRRSDGSVAWNLDTIQGAVVTIHNVTTERTYIKLGAREWMVTQLADGARLPPRHELRFLRRDVHITSDPVIGDVIEHANSRTGDVARIAPALNGFKVSWRLGNGTSQEFSNIQVGEQPDEWFLPPAGVQPREVDAPLLPGERQR